MTNATQITISLKGITPEMIGKCYKCFDGQGKPFYMVESSEDSQVEYKVSSIMKNGRWFPTCTCESGKNGFHNCSQGFCWHVRAAWAAAQEEKAALAELAAASCVPMVAPAPVEVPAVATTVDADTLKRVMNARPSKSQDLTPQSPRAFNFMRV